MDGYTACYRRVHGFAHLIGSKNVCNFQMNRVAIELDEVLFPFIKPMMKHFQKDLPQQRYFHYTHGDLLNVGDCDCRKMIRSYFDSERFSLIQPIKGSQPILRLLKPGFKKVYVVASRPLYMREKTEEWIDFHFPGIFDDLIFASNYLNRRELEKYDICTSLNIDTLIDDDEIDCAVCLNNGMNVIHFAGDQKVYPWSRCDEWSVVGWNDLYNRVYNHESHSLIEVV